MSHQTCQIPAETVQHFKQFRFQKSTATSALILKIDQNSLLVLLDQKLDACTLADISDELPESSPRFIVLR
jgi:hypothetical protein